MLFADFKPLRSALLCTFSLLLCLIATPPAMAADPMCDVLVPNTCIQPDLGLWDVWRPVIDNKPGVARATESEAIEAAVAVLTKTYPCGLSYATVSVPYSVTSKVLDWASKEDAPRIQFVGFVAGVNNACLAITPDVTGTVVIRRERRVRCPRGYGWLMRDDFPTVCVKD